MPAAVQKDPLGIWCMFSDGSTAQFDLSGLPCPGLAADLLAGLAEMVHPHGSIDAAGTVYGYVLAIRDMSRSLSGAGFTGGAADLRRPHVTEYWMGTAPVRESRSRRVLAAFACNGGAVDPEVAELAAGRNFNPVPFRPPVPPYREAEWERLAVACSEAISAAFAAHREALAAAARGAHRREQGWSRENLAWLLSRTGPVTVGQVAELLGCSQGAARKRSGFQDVSGNLFPTLDVVISYGLLFGIYSGIVPDGIADLVTGDIDWAGDASVLLSYVKRRTAAESMHLPRRAVRLLEQWLAHSALLRGLASPGDRDRLWLGVSRPGAGTLVREVDATVVQGWVLRHNVTSDDGGPLKIHRSRIRTTHLSLRDKGAWAGRGRATIDPNHSPQVEGDHYLTAATPAQQRAVEEIVANAQHDLIRRASPPAVLTTRWRRSSRLPLRAPLMLVEGTPRLRLVALIWPGLAPGRCLHLLGQLLGAAGRDKRPLAADRDPHPFHGIKHNAPPREPGPEPACVVSRVGVVVWHGIPPTLLRASLFAQHRTGGPGPL